MIPQKSVGSLREAKRADEAEYDVELSRGSGWRILCLW